MAVIESGRTRRLRLGMVGGGSGAFIGAVHRIAARIDDRYELVAGALSSDPATAAAQRPPICTSPNRSGLRLASQTWRHAEATRQDRHRRRVDRHAEPPARSPARALPARRHRRDLRQAALTSTLARHAPRAGVSGRRRRKSLLALRTTTPAIPDDPAGPRDGRGRRTGQHPLVQVEYAQDWLTTRSRGPPAKTGRLAHRPARSGAAGAIGDIGTHAFNLAEFVAGQDAPSSQPISPPSSQVAASTTTRKCCCASRGRARLALGKPGRRRQREQPCLRVYGEKAALSWRQEHPETRNLLLASVNRPWPSVVAAPRSVRQPPMPPASLRATRKVIWKVSPNSTAMLQPNCGRGRLRLLWIR